MEINRKIIHVDMDSFFVSVEERENPKLKNKPVAVGGNTDRSVISTANYIARKFGVHSAMASSIAKRKCPELIIVPHNFEIYKQVSNTIRDIFKEYTPLVEPISLDEAFLDVSKCTKCYGSATWMAEQIRKKIFEAENLTASAGISVNKFVAKVASDWNKPNGQLVVPPHKVYEFVSKLPVRKIFGVGPKTANKLHMQNINFCKDLQKISHADLINKFGKFGSYLFDICRGIDNRPVESNKIRKSLSVEETFIEDLKSIRACKKQIDELIIELKRRLNKNESSDFKKIFVKIKFNDFTSTTIETICNTLDNENFYTLLEEGLNRKNKKVRLLGLGVRFSEETKQLSLF